MNLEDQYLLKWFLKCREIDDDSLNFLAILGGGQDLFQGGKLPPLGYATVAKAATGAKDYEIFNNDLRVGKVWKEKGHI